jgi:hypothetical protein
MGIAMAASAVRNKREYEIACYDMALWLLKGSE